MASVGKHLYLSGPMTGLPGLNYVAFDRAAADLRARGIKVISPAEMDAATRAAAATSTDGDEVVFAQATGQTRGRLLGDDLRLIIDTVDAVVVLPGWQRSGGALLETFAAVLHNKRVLHYPSLRKVPRRTLVRAWLRYIGGR